MILETERLILDTWQSADWTELRPIATDIEVMHYITGGVPWDDEQIRTFVERQVKLFADRKFCRWKLISKADGSTFGGVGFWRDAPEPEIGWWLERRSWGRGLATEAASAALRHVFEHTDLDRIISIARPENSASTRVMSKIGMTFECEFESEGLKLVRYAIHRGKLL